MIRSSHVVISRSTARFAKRLARPFSKRKLFRATRVMWPALAALTVTSIAHAQGTMDFSGATTLMGTFKTFAIYAGAVICFGGLIFAGIRMLSGRFQFVAPVKELGVANRDLGTIQRIEDGRMTVQMDSKEKRSLTFDTAIVRQLDHGYADTSHSSQGLTAERVIAHFDTEGPRGLVNTRLAYVAISRASHDAHIYTNDAARLGKRLATDVSKTAAIGLFQPSKNTEVERAVLALRENDPATATTILQRDSRVHEYASVEHRIAAVALAYAAGQDRAVVVVPDATERKELTQLIRDELRQRGRLSAESHGLPVWVEQRLGNPRLAANYAAGDQIYYKVRS